MKRIVIILLFLFIGATTFAQNPKYDGDWKAPFSGVCADRDMDGPIREGSGQWWYRILTMEDYTTVRVKVRYPCENDFEYWDCHVTRCDDNTLEWFATINQYQDFEEGVSVTIEYHCTIRKFRGMLAAQCYYTQKNYNNNGHLIKNNNYGHKNFNLYNESDDW